MDENSPEFAFKGLNLDINTDKIIFVKSKSDLQGSIKDVNDNSLLLSSKNNEGIGALLKLLSTKLSSVFGAHSDVDPIIVSKRQKNLLLDAQRISEQAMSLSTQNIETDILASILHGLNDTLSEIIGNVSSTDVVNNIFSEFCIGK